MSEIQNRIMNVTNILQLDTNRVINLPNYLNTSDANATVNDILLGKTAYVNGVKLIGTYNGGSGGGDVKLYDSITNMNLDHNVDDGQLAIVYYNESANITANTEFQIGTFPEVVVLPTAITDHLEVGFRAVDESVMFECWGQLNANRYGIDCYTDSGDIRIEYSSQDGITYTRTQFRKNGEEISGDEMDFGLTIKFGSRWGEAQWDDRIGYFTQTGNVALDGLYQYIDNSYGLAKTQFTSSSELVYNSLFYGKNGIENGSMQNVENLNINQMITKSLIYSDISSLELNENVTNLHRTFAGKTQIRAVPMINTTNVTDASYMFADCTNLTNIPNFNTSNVTNMAWTFAGCSNLISIPNFNTANVTNTRVMFSACYNLKSVPNFDTSNVTDMTSMFIDCYNLSLGPNYNTNKVKYAAYMFQNCYNLTDMFEFNMPNVFNTQSMFANCYNLTNIAMFTIKSPINGTNMYSMFDNCNNLSANSYANITNSLPIVNDYIGLNVLGLNVQNFTREQCQILSDKGYSDATQYVINSANVSNYWNIYYE